MDSIHPWLDADELKQLAESLMQGDRRPPAPVDNEAAFGDGFVGFAADGPNPPAHDGPNPPAHDGPNPPAHDGPNPPAHDGPNPPAAGALNPLAAGPFNPPAADAPNPSALTRPVAAPPVPQEQAPTTPQSSPPPTEPAAPAVPSLPPMASPRPATSDSSPASSPLGPPPSPVASQDSPSPALSGADASCHQLQSRLAETFGAEKIFILNRDGHTVFGKDHHAHLQFIARSLTRDAERRGLPKGHIHIKVGPGQVLEIVPVSLPNGGWVVGTVLPGPLGPEDIKVWVTEISRLSSSLNQL